LSLLAILSTSASGAVISYEIDPTQSQLVLTVAGVDFPGAVHGTYLLILDPDLTPGASAQVFQMDAWVEDIHMGFASLTDITVITDPDTASYGGITDPDPADSLYTLNQVSDLIISGTYTPLFGNPEPFLQHAVLCMSDSSFCGATPDGEGTIQYFTLRSRMFGATVIPASENPLGEDIPVSLTVVSDGTWGGPAGASINPGAGAPVLKAWPNPTWSGRGMRIRAGTGNRLDILAVGGRRILTLRAVRSEPGASEFVWDGCDATGQRVPPGVYFLRHPVSGATAKVLVFD
jgi:hypothetical protein